ncbi:MutS-related protein [Spirillospora sp. CA-294931]|uniref:MutS-related protein n=1 Tax=Spirillospora sp. CA-294931 TaxID=3240042 RepID=UPI003D8FC855
MGVRSILFATPDPTGEPDDAEPGHFRDLNLDQVVRAVAEAAGAAGVARYLHRPLRDAESVAFRQQIFRDLEDPAVLQTAERFTASMARTRSRLEALERRKHPPQAHRWFLEIVLDHTAAVIGLAEGLDASGAASPGLRALRDDLAGHIRSAGFTGLLEGARRLRERLGEIRYDVLVRGDEVSVAPHEEDGRFDHADRVLAWFERFRQGPPSGETEGAPALGLDFVEAGVLDLVAELFPGLFGDLAAFCAANRDFPAPELDRLDRELRFYLGYLSFLAPVRAAGLPICTPAVSATRKDLLARDVYDLALAAKHPQVVTNDLRLDGTERVLVVSGPNQGGKTTLARTFGQLHHLAALGCPVPGREVRIFLADAVLTHFEREEAPGDLTSGLEAELIRMRALLKAATPRSVIVLNEVFSSTTPDDARALSETVLASIVRLDAACLWVSFVDALALTSPAAVSMVGAEERSYRFVRRAADGRAHALALAERHGLTYAQITARARR